MCHFHFKSPRIENEHRNQPVEEEMICKNNTERSQHWTCRAAPFPQAATTTTRFKQRNTAGDVPGKLCIFHPLRLFLLEAIVPPAEVKREIDAWLMENGGKTKQRMKILPRVVVVDWVARILVFLLLILLSNESSFVMKCDKERTDGRMDGVVVR